MNYDWTTGVQKFISMRPTLRACNFTYFTRSGALKMGGQNQGVRPIETQLETLLFVLYYLKAIVAFVLNVFPSKVLY